MDRACRYNRENAHETVAFRAFPTPHNATGPRCSQETLRPVAGGAFARPERSPPAAGMGCAAPARPVPDAAAPRPRAPCRFRPPGRSAEASACPPPILRKEMKPMWQCARCETFNEDERPYCLICKTSVSESRRLSAESAPAAPAMVRPATRAPAAPATVRPASRAPAAPATVRPASRAPLTAKPASRIPAAAARAKPPSGEPAAPPAAEAAPPPAEAEEESPRWAGKLALLIVGGLLLLLAWLFGSANT